MSEIVGEKPPKSRDSSLDQNSAVAPSHHQDSDLESAPATEIKAEKSGPDPSAFPDGGLEAWLVVVGGFCIVFASFGWINCE